MKKYTLRSPSPKHEVWAVQRIWESGLKGNELLVAAILSMHGSPQGTDMRPSIATIAWWTSLSIATVKRVLRSLRRKQCLVVTREADNTDHRATEYAWNFEALPPKVALPKFLDEQRQFKRWEESRREKRRKDKATKPGAQSATPEAVQPTLPGVQIDTPAGGQIDPPKKPVSGGSNRPFRGVTAVTPEVKEEVRRGSEGVAVEVEDLKAIGLPSSSSSTPVSEALLKYGAVSKAAAAGLLKACRKHDPKATPQEVVAAIEWKAAAITEGVRNPIGLLLRTIPECFEPSPARDAIRADAKRRASTRVITCHMCDHTYESDGRRTCPNCRAEPLRITNPQLAEQQREEMLRYMALRNQRDRERKAAAQ